MEITATGEQLSTSKLMVATPMYGGQCFGQYTRSMIDLGLLCQRYNIPLVVYYLSNESLIQRARNYCIQRNSIVITEDGSKKISWIVKNKYKGKVLSMINGKHVWNNVLNHWERNNTDNKKWVLLKSSTRAKTALICTEEHEVSCINDIMNPVVSFKQAKNMKNEYAVRLENKSKSNRTMENTLYNNDQLSIIFGTLMGDSSVSKNGVFSTTHSLAQLQYIKDIQEILGGTITTRTTINKFPNGTAVECHRCDLNTDTNDQTKKMRELFFENGKKTIKNVLSYLDEKALAFWYCDDGSLIKPKNGTPYSVLYTMGFSYDDHLLMKQWFKDKYDINVSINKNTDKWILQFSIEDTIKFQNLIGKYVPKSMRYKLISEYDEYKFDNKRLDYSSYKIENVIYLNENDSRCGKLYDIEVENAHNFYANGTLVHNCADEFMRSDCTHLMFIDSDVGFDANDVVALLALTHMNKEYSIIGGPYPKKNISWEKIKHAVDNGHANEDPNNLEKYVGDYVFNLKSTGSFRLDEPVEVAELGTGFMMIQRHVFEEMDKHFPEYKYKPDHARTEQFDGSRMISAYFDCPIDRGYTFGDLKQLTEKMISASIDELPLLLEQADNMLSLETKASMRLLSEDYFFCHAAQKIGLKTWLCPWMKLNHTGSYTFGGSLADILTIGAHPTADTVKPKRKEK